MEKLNNNTWLGFANQDIPAFVEVKGKDWIYYGENNDYPNYLIDLYQQSAYHSSIIDGKVDYIAGNGWTFDKLGMNTLEQARASEMIKQPFNDQDSLNDMTMRWALDYELFNGFAIKVIWAKGGKVSSLHYIDFCNLRTNADCTEFYYTTKWFKTARNGKRSPNNAPQQEADYKVFKAFDTKNKTGEQIYYVKAGHPDMRVYPLPVYKGAVSWINIDVLLAKYFFETVDGSFLPTHVFNFYNGNPPTEEMADTIEQKIRDKFTGKGYNGQGALRFMLNFAQSKDNGMDIQALQMTDADKQYEAVRKYSEQAIFTGHRIPSPMLFGIKTEGQLGGNTELAFSERLFQKSYVDMRQNTIETAINELADYFGVNISLRLNKVSNVGYMFSDAVIEAVLTPEEKRAAVLKQLGISPTLQKFEAQSDEDILIEKFTKASHFKQYRILSERIVEDFSKEGIEKSEFEAKQAFVKEQLQFAIKANQLERNIIDLLSKDNTLQPDAIANAIKSTPDTVKSAIKRLTDRGILKPIDITDTNKGYNVTDKGQAALDEKPAKTANVFVVYKYGLAPKFRGENSIIEGSRKFCREMIKMSDSGKRWTSEDIFALDNGTDPKYGLNAWSNRGGWYTLPNGGHVAQCRHAWIQEVVTEVQ